MQDHEIEEFVEILEYLARTLKKENRIKVQRLQELFAKIAEPRRTRAKAQKGFGITFNYQGWNPLTEISRVVQALTNASALYNSAYEDVGKLDHAVTDLLHGIELLDEDNNEEERLKKYEELRALLHIRRTSKDFVELVRPLSQLSNANKAFLDELAGAKKQIQERMKALENRVYTPRQLTAMQAAFETATAIKKLSAKDDAK